MNMELGKEFDETFSNEFEKEFESLKGEVDALKKMLEQVIPQGVKIPTGETKRVGHIEKMENMHHDENIRACIDNLENIAGENGQTGAITYMGVFASGGRQSTWVRAGVNTDNLLNLISENVAQKVLACIGNADRLKILLALLNRPMTVAELVTECGLNTTGQAYHHMKPLQAADLIAEETKGTYVVQPYKVQGIIMLLAGISDMVDETISQNSWDEVEE